MIMTTLAFQRTRIQSLRAALNFKSITSRSSTLCASSSSLLLSSSSLVVFSPQQRIQHFSSTAASIETRSGSISISNANFLNSHKNNTAHNEDKIGRLILVRHGQSEWNVTCPKMGTTARFTGWADIGLTSLGYEQAIASGKAIQSFLLDSTQNTANVTGASSNRIMIDAVYCSLLSRAKDTMNLALKELDLLVPLDNSKDSNQNVNDGDKNTPSLNDHYYKIPVITSWRLNERHYGSLVGLSKDGAERLYGKEQLTKWRDGWDVPPPPMDIQQLRKWRDLDHTRPATVVTDTKYFDKTFLKTKIKKEAGDINTCSRSSESSDSNDNNPSKSGSRSRQFTIWEKGPFFNDSFDDGDNTTSRITTRDLAGSLKDTTLTPMSTELHNDDNINDNNMPASESLSDCCRRILPIFEDGIAPRLRSGQTVVVFAHANTIRSILYHIDPNVVTKHTMKQVKIPSATPLLYSFQNAAENFEDNKELMENSDNAKDSIGKIRIPGDLYLTKISDINGNGKLNKDSVELNGQWLKNSRLENLSFCSVFGEKYLEHEIA
jgi:bisphosphoglycerate-dependent phosphoglycerate mutase